jgi:class 3 adenylate cyclase
VIKAPPTTERRLVSVLFADLVGFTTLSERLDPEDVRELLTRYSETFGPLIARYGGTVEKFIGDAVMAVWGAPAAREDDAERAVRTALDLADAVPALGQDMGISDLSARVGVATGEAAVTIGATNQAMVAGDLVNTASRIQGVAPPGSVFVAESTKRATEAAIVYEDMGPKQLKGKAQPLRLSRAIRVIGLKKGALRSSRLEPPFVGDAMLRLIKEQFHASSEECKARLISVTGDAGMGKSRLEWEFRKYLDGLADPPLWHRGRCLPYGDGVTYAALAEMVRRRAGIAEGEDRATALPKLESALELYLPDGDERQRVMPRLAHLVGFEDRAASNPQDLFSAWRRFFEGLAEHSPTVMIFEDLHWADAALLEFINHLMDWSRNYRLFVLTLARPELSGIRAGEPAGPPSPSSTSIHCPPAPWRSSSQGWSPAFRHTCAPGFSSEPRASRCTRSRPFACCSIAACSCRKAAPTARPGRSGPWTCRRPCRPSSASASTASTPTSVRSCRTPPSWEGPSRSPPWRRSPDVPRPISSPCSPA